MRTLILLVSITLSLMTGEVNAHASAVGYVNSGQNCVTMWYKSWHGNAAPFTEGSLDLVGINGNSFPLTNTAFDLTSGTLPSGLIAGDNYFFACSSNPNGFCSTDEDQQGGNKWQGVEYCGLQPGDYQFTYIPIANPSQDWEPATPGVLSNVFSLDAAALGGGGTQAVPTLSEWALIILSLAMALTAMVMLPRRRYS
jgi:hypothetical protein